MRTKVLLCAAALAASLASSMAQNVYSLNVVGYVNVTVAAGGFALLANPLKTANNYLDEVVPPASVALNSTLSTWNATQQKFIDIALLDLGAGAQWVDPADGTPLGTSTTLPPGKGFLLNNAGGALTVTFVGEVKQGDVTVPMPVGNGCYGISTPQDLQLSAANGFPMIENNYAHVFDTVNVKYIDHIILDTGDGNGMIFRDPATGDPFPVQPGIGRGFFIENSDAVAHDWVRTFTVQ